LKRVLPTGGFFEGDEDANGEKKSIINNNNSNIETLWSKWNNEDEDKWDEKISSSKKLAGLIDKQVEPPLRSSIQSAAVDQAAAANQLAAEIARAKALLVPKFKPKTVSGLGVLKFRGDWGSFGCELYNGPFVDGHEHGEAQWVVPTDNNGGRMVRRGTWVNGERLNWISYPVSKEQTKAFVEAFSKPKTFHLLHAEMVADGFPHLPDGVDNTDPAVKMIVSGILRAHSKTAGAAVIHQIEKEKKYYENELNNNNLKLIENNMNFNDGRNELFDYMDDIDERRTIIKELKRDLHILNKRIQEHWDKDTMNLRDRYHQSVQNILNNPIQDWIKMRGLAPMKNSVSLVLEAMCITLGLDPTFTNAIVLFNDRDQNVKKGDRESVVLNYDVKLKDYLIRKRFNYFQLCEAKRLLKKPDSRQPFEHHKKGILIDGEWIKNPQPPSKGIWKLRSYVENLEFRPNNIKILKYGLGLGLIIEWVISSYKCACYVDEMIDIEHERNRLRDKIYYLKMELTEEEEEMWEFDENYRSLLKDVIDMENNVMKNEKKIRELNNVLNTIHTMRNEKMIPATLEDDVEVVLLGTGCIQYHTKIIENVEPKTLWGGGNVDEDGIELQHDDVINIYSPTTKQVCTYTVDSVGNGEIILKEDILMVTEKNIHIRKVDTSNINNIGGQSKDELRQCEWLIKINPSIVEASAGETVTQGSNKGTLKQALRGSDTETTSFVIQCSIENEFDMHTNFLIDNTFTLLSKDIIDVINITKDNTKNDFTHEEHGSNVEENTSLALENNAMKIENEVIPPLLDNTKSEEMKVE
jgi:hypothetical protein